MRSLESLLIVWAFLAAAAAFILVVNWLDNQVQRLRRVQPMPNGRMPTGLVGKFGIAILAVAGLMLLITQGGGAGSGMADGCVGSMRC